MMAQTAAALADAMIARWDAAGAARAAAFDARANDARMTYLHNAFISLGGPNVANFADVVDSATSVRAAREKRAGKLWLARGHQMSRRFVHLYDTPVDFGPAIRRLLRDAAMWRMMEKSRAETESMRAEFDRIERIA